MRIVFLLQSIIYAQRGAGGDRSSGSFKQNRLNRMFRNEITWLDKYFGQTAVTTEEYLQHDNRIREHWALKLERNKERLIKRLVKCGGDDSFTNAVAEQAGGFSEYDEEKAKEEIKVPTSDDQEDLGVLDTESQTANSSGRPSSSGRGRRDVNVEFYQHSSTDLAAIAGLDFDYEIEDVTFGVSSGMIQARSGGRGSAPPVPFNPKEAIKEIRNILQGFAIWAKNHIPNCEPNQPEKQMARASRWFKILGKKVMAKTMHIQATRREGLPVLNG